MALTADRFEQIKRFEKDLSQCMKCGFCTFWCPVYQEERIEASVARGKNMMIRGLLAGELDYTQEYADRLNKCTLCMTCTANCPAKANIPNVIVAARADAVKARGLNFPYNIVYRWLLPRRRLFGWVVRFASWFQGVFMPKTEGTIRHLSMFLSALGKGRNIPQIAPRFLRQMVPVVNVPPASVKTRMRVGYFSGCMTDFVLPHLGKHIIDFLTRNGVEVVVPREQGCCGAPVFLGAGDFEAGRKMADANVKAFEGLDYVISDCATCTSALKDYAKFLADTPQRKKAYEKFAKKVKDISEFLIDVLDLPASAYKPSAVAKGKKVSWHDPCHLSRHLGITSQPRQVIKSISGVEYVEMPNADRCCGMAGAFSMHYYDLSKEIGDKKAASIKSTGADIVVSSCPGCEIQLIDSLLRNKVPVKVMHIMELLE
ncbi:MAG: (Fe-S)-binding protein [Dehalococcoidales bacterium]|nr:(Fe-S)-binding protein [Dehalococcoidales bacterium]